MSEKFVSPTIKVEKKGGIDFPSSGTKDSRCVVDDGVDTGDMNKDRQAESDKHRAPDAGAEQVMPGALFRLKAGLDFLHFKFGVACSGNALEDGECFLLFFSLKKKSGSFRRK